MLFKVSFGYKSSNLIFNNLQFEIPDGKITILCGHNGAGKTTLLKYIGGIFPSKNPVEESWYVSATGGLIYHFSLFEHLKMMNAFSLLEENELVKEAFSLFEANTFANKKISKLSTGQVMMASIIVAFASRKKMLLLDEPFGCLDPKNAANLSYLLKVATKSGITVLATAHDLYMTAETADNICFLKNGNIVFNTCMSSEITVELLMNTYKEIC